MNNDISKLSKKELIERLSFLEQALEENESGHTAPNTYGAESSSILEEYNKVFNKDYQYYIDVTFRILVNSSIELSEDDFSKVVFEDLEKRMFEAISMPPSTPRGVTKAQWELVDSMFDTCEI